MASSLSLHLVKRPSTYEFLCSFGSSGKEVQFSSGSFLQTHCAFFPKQGGGASRECESDTATGKATGESGPQAARDPSATILPSHGNGRTGSASTTGRSEGACSDQSITPCMNTHPLTN